MCVHDLAWPHCNHAQPRTTAPSVLRLRCLIDYMPWTHVCCALGANMVISCTAVYVPHCPRPLAADVLRMCVCLQTRDPLQQLFVAGSSCQIARVGEAHAANESGANLVPWNGDSNNMIDRCVDCGVTHYDGDRRVDVGSRAKCWMDAAQARVPLPHPPSQGSPGCLCGANARCVQCAITMLYSFPCASTAAAGLTFGHCWTFTVNLTHVLLPHARKRKRSKSWKRCGAYAAHTHAQHHCSSCLCPTPSSPTLRPAFG
jgi:hypothetical protein